MKLGRVLLCGTTVAALALAGCSSSGEAQPKTFHDVAKLANAVSTSTKGAKSVHAKLNLRMSGAKLLSGDGTFDMHGKQLAMRMNANLNFAKITQLMKKGMEQQGGHFQMQGGPKNLQVKLIAANGSCYLKAPQQFAAMAGDPSKPWHELGDASKALGKIGSMADKADPGKQLEKLKDISKIDKTASGEIDGQHVTHYWITINTRKAMQQLPEAKRQEKSGVVSELPKTVPMQLWLNDKQLPMKMKMNVAAGGKKLAIGLRFSDWGKKANITAPPKNKIGKPISVPEGGGN